MLNPWAWLQYTHNMCGTVVTASFVMSSVGALYILQKREGNFGQIFLRLGVIAGVLSCVAMIFPTGDLHGKYVAKHQPLAMAGMEGLFHSEKGAPVVLLGQPDYETQKIDNPLAVNKLLSFLIYGTTVSEVQGLDAYPKDQWPTALPLLFYSYHIMAGLGTYFAALMAVSAFLLWRGKLFTSRWLLWPILLSFPLPYIANTAGWITAEVGRQPWVAYGLVRTADGYSRLIGASTSLFTLIGFMGMYTVLAILWILLVYHIIEGGPKSTSELAADKTLKTA
jgi:cytochrome d ubiquinol oxidase subunit I